jgi:UDP-N-acetylmuramate: L-alanyl-gamma-D-glutamyl-meso-diaminopimelate ligase
MLGEHNMANAAAAAAAAAHVGVSLTIACEALSLFKGVKRRMELLGTVDGIRIYDDFAHHPTAIRTTLDGLRKAMTAGQSSGRLLVLIEARSNTMKMGHHQATLADSVTPADAVVWYRSEATRLDLDAIAQAATCEFLSMGSVAEILAWATANARPGDHVVIMSNGGFEGIHQRLLQALQSRAGA